MPDGEVFYDGEMPNYRRANIPGGTFFFTLVTDQRIPIFASQQSRMILGHCFRDCLERWPFTINALVLLPDHLHAIWSLPSGDSKYSVRWGWIKKEFTKRWLTIEGSEATVSAGRSRERRRGIWQPRFWEHTIDDDEDYERHFDYVHFNPVKHGYVKCPHEWEPSTFHRWVKQGVYPPDWACGTYKEPRWDFKDIEATVGE